MKKMIRCSSDIFTEEFKDDKYSLYGKRDSAWNQFFVETLQPYCNKVLEDFNVWSEIDLSKNPKKIIFYDTADDSVLFQDDFRPYCDDILDIWLDEKTSSYQIFKDKLKKMYEDMFEEV